MKLKIVLSCLVIVAMIGCNSNQNSQKKKNLEELQVATETTQNYVLSNNAAGDFKIGSELIFPKETDNLKVEKEIQTKMVEGEAEETVVYNVSANNEKLLQLKPAYDLETGNVSKKIEEILVLSEKFKTENGIGVSSTIEEFISTYPTYKIWYTYVSESYVLEADGVNLQFMLNKNDFISKIEITSDVMPLQKTDFKPNSKIIEVRIY